MNPAGIGRRAALIALAGAAGPCVAQAPARSLEDWRRLLAAPETDADNARRRQLLAIGEAALAAGDAVAAQEAFQRAALMAHAADTECSIVRAHMQAGEYRRALAFGAHAALAHRDYPAGSALYAWLLHAGGQARYAAQRLDEALARTPDDAALRQAREQLAQAWPCATGSLLAAPLRIAPYAHGADRPRTAVRIVGTAVLADEGRAALVPLATLGAAATLWLRNGLGATSAARVEARIEPLGVARLRLAPPLAAPVALLAAAREPFAGSAGSTVEFAAHAGDAPAWPLLRQGFFGRATTAGERLLGIALPAGPRGGPVFDAAGHLAGLSLAGDGAPDGFVPTGVLQASAGVHWRVAASPSPAAPIDAVYESALTVALQVIV